MPPPSRNQRTPTAGDTPATTPASSLDKPCAIAAQNRCRSSRRATGGRPGERIGARPARSARRRFAAPIATLLVVEALRRPVESAQYLSIRYTERLAAAGIAPSVGSVGDSYDNALAESVIGLYKTEVVRRQGPWRHVEAVEFATLAWVDWFNTRRLLAPIGYVPPIEFEDAYYREQHCQTTPAMGAGIM